MSGPFDFILPAIGGIAGGFLGGPMGAAVGSGLGSFVSTGDVGKGIMSGMLGYGLGSAGELLGGLGGEAGAAGAVGTDAGTWATPASMAMPAGASSITADAMSPAISSGALNVGSSAGTAASRGLGGFDLSGDSLWNTFGKHAMKTTLPIGLGAMGMLGGMGGGGGQSVGPPPPYQGSTPDMNARTNRRYLGPGTASPQGYEQRYFEYAEGGDIEENDRLRRLIDIKNARKIRPSEAERLAREYDERKVDTTGRFNLASPEPGDRQYAQPMTRFAGGGVTGPGSGLDDAIPAIVNGRQPAALSDGEYVVPAHAVSALGNGSTDHGVRQLDGMVDKVMQHKYGSKNRKPRPINPANLMPGGQGARPFASGGAVARMMNGQATMDDYLEGYADLGSGSRSRPAMQSYEQPSQQTMASQPSEQPQAAQDDDEDLASARERISRLESGGNYGALGPMVGQDRAYGRYQVMGANVPSWTKAALGREMTPEEYLGDKGAQDAVFNHRFGGYMKKYGAAGASRAWFAGEGGMNNYGAKDVLGTSVADYQRRAGYAEGGDIQMAAAGDRWEDPVTGLTYESVGPTQPEDFNVEDYAGRFPLTWGDPSAGGKRYFRSIHPKAFERYDRKQRKDLPPVEFFRRIDGFPTS